MKKTVLPFTGKQWLQYGNGTRQPIIPTYAYANGTGVFDQRPLGATWALNPLPDREQFGKRQGQLTFPAPCNDNTDPPTKGLCSGERPFQVAVVDALQIPTDLQPGHYVLGFRWDAEETAQVWSSCADILIL